MPKLTPAQMKKAVEEFKKKFTGGFYHGSPSPNIKAFDSTKNTDPTKLETPGVTFVTRDPDFAESFLPGSERGGYKAGATMYPVKVNLGKHWDPKQKEGQQVLKEYLEKMYPHEANPKDLIDIQKDMSQAKWTDIENPNFLQYLRDTGHDTFHVMEGGIPNVGVLKPQNIRGKFAKFNPEDAESADFMKAAGGRIAKKALEHARQVPFVHYSNAPNISTLDPNRYGTGIKGAEAGRLKSAPDIRPRSYFYVDQGEKTMPKEAGLGPHKYTGTAEGIYPLEDDPMGFSAIAKQKALDPYLASKGIMQADEREHLNELERLIKGAGYSGYSNNAVGLLFNPTQVIKSD